MVHVNGVDAGTIGYPFGVVVIAWIIEQQRTVGIGAAALVSKKAVAAPHCHCANVVDITAGFPRAFYAAGLGASQG
jgi:hypothetical protein